MSSPSPERYEREKGMHAHNQVMREVRSRSERTYDPSEPTRVWLDEDNTPDGVMESLTIILNTGGCRWARAGGCTMCGYVAESVEGGSVSHDMLVSQIEESLAYESSNRNDPAPLVKIYTSGSFLDEREVGADTREWIAKKFSDRDRIVLESLPDFVDGGKLTPFLDVDVDVDIAIGLETASDRIRRDCVNKYFTFDAFEEACAIADEVGAGVKAYLLMKPPFLSEGEAIEDMISSVEACESTPGCHTVSMNPCNVQRYTMVDDLYFNGGYRPPWLWSIVSVLDATANSNVLVVSDPVGHGSKRGPHNCLSCDERVYRAITDFNLRQQPAVFDQVSCACERTWELVREHETGYNMPLSS